MKQTLLSKRLAYKNNTPYVKVSPKAHKAISDFKKEHIELKSYPCFCGSNNNILISEVDRYGFYYPMVICQACGLMRTNPRMDDKTYKEFYRTKYRDIYETRTIEESYQQKAEESYQKYSYFKNKIPSIG